MSQAGKNNRGRNKEQKVKKGATAGQQRRRQKNKSTKEHKGQEATGKALMRPTKTANKVERRGKSEESANEAHKSAEQQ